MCYVSNELSHLFIGSVPNLCSVSLRSAAALRSRPIYVQFRATIIFRVKSGFCERCQTDGAIVHVYTYPMSSKADFVVLVL